MRGQQQSHGSLQMIQIITQMAACFTLLAEDLFVLYLNECR